VGNNRKIYITGGTGFIGTKITKALKAKGYTVIVFTRNPMKYRSSGIASEYINYPNTLEDLSEILDGCFGVINLAGEPVVGKRWTDAQKKVLWDSRVETTESIAKAIQMCKNPPRRLLSASGTGYYGPRDNDEVAESSLPGDDFLAKLCVAWEDAANKARSDQSTVCIMRTGIVLDAGAGALGKLSLPFRFKVGGHLGDGKQYYPWIHIDDVIGMYLFYLERDDNTVVNVVAPDPVNMRTFAKTLARVLGGFSWLHVPSIVIELILGEASITVLKGQRAIPEKAISDGYSFAYASLGDALEDIY